MVLFPAPPPFATAWTLCIDPGPSFCPLQGLLICSTQLHLSCSHVARLWLVREGAVCTGPPQPLAHSPSWSSPACAALYWPSVALPCCWIEADAHARGTGQCPRVGHTNLSSVVLKGETHQLHSSVGLSSPAHHQKLMEMNFILYHLCFLRGNETFFFKVSVM